MKANGKLFRAPSGCCQLRRQFVHERAPSAYIPHKPRRREATRGHCGLTPRNGCKHQHSSSVPPLYSRSSPLFIYWQSGLETLPGTRLIHKRATSVQPPPRYTMFHAQHTRAPRRISQTPRQRMFRNPEPLEHRHGQISAASRFSGLGDHEWRLRFFTRASGRISGGEPR